MDATISAEHFRSRLFRRPYSVTLPYIAYPTHARALIPISDSSRVCLSESLAQELERMRKATPALKYCRGEPFKEEHWSALLQVPPVSGYGFLQNFRVDSAYPAVLCVSFYRVPGPRGLGEPEFIFNRRRLDFKGKLQVLAVPRLRSLYVFQGLEPAMHSLVMLCVSVYRIPGPRSLGEPESIPQSLLSISRGKAAGTSRLSLRSFLSPFTTGSMCKGCDY